jgi:CubicO group peptidase (beta-lactamase class C family)
MNLAWTYGPAALVVLGVIDAPGSGHRTPRNSELPAIRVHHDPDLSSRLEEFRSTHRVPGIGAAILRGDELRVAVAGIRRVGINTPLADGDAFHLGSDTKAITASVVARLVDRGVLRWDEPMAEACPDTKGMDPAFKTVTLDMLMRHTAGLPQSGAFTPEFTAGFGETWPIAKQRAWMAERFLSRPPKETPGSPFGYSNYGYLIIGHIVERATGKTWEDLVREEVFRPLGMIGCGFGPTATTKKPEGNWAHDVKDGKYVPTEEDNPILLGPAGTIHCPLAAWARFARAHACPDWGGWITPKSMHHLHEPLVIAGTSPGKDIGLGWGVTRTHPPRITHSGSNGYNVAEIVVIPDWKAAVLVACNAGDERAHALCTKIRDMLVDKLITERLPPRTGDRKEGNDESSGSPSGNYTRFRWLMDSSRCGRPQNGGDCSSLDCDARYKFLHTPYAKHALNGNSSCRKKTLTNSD